MKPAENRSPAPATQGPMLTLRLPMVKTARQGTDHRHCFLPHACHEPLCTRHGADSVRLLSCSVSLRDARTA